MKTIPTKFEIMSAFFNGTSIKINDVLIKRVNSVEHEDGSGIRFNVGGYDSVGNKVSVFCQTID